MMTKQTDTVAMTDEQLDGVSGGPHYTDFRGGFQLVGGTMCSARASKQPPAEQNKRPYWLRPLRDEA
jgi:hypothetical protein